MEGHDLERPPGSIRAPPHVVHTNALLNYAIISIDVSQSEVHKAQLNQRLETINENLFMSLLCFAL